MEDFERDGDSMSSRRLAGARDPERGSALILIAFLWTSLFAMAALAIDLMANTALTGATYDIDGGQQLVER